MVYKRSLCQTNKQTAVWRLEVSSGIIIVMYYDREQAMGA